MKDDQQDGGDQAAPTTPSTIYETDCMDADEIEMTNRNYRAMGLDVVVIDVSKFTAKNERQPDGTLRRTKLRKSRRANETPTNPGQPAGG